MDHARRTWQDMMHDGRAVASKGIRGSPQAKPESAASSWVPETQFESVPDIGEPQEGSSQVAPDPISQVTRSILALDLSLTLSPPLRGKAKFDLNLEPEDHEHSPTLTYTPEVNTQNITLPHLIPLFPTYNPSQSPAKILDN